MCVCVCVCIYMYVGCTWGCSGGVLVLGTGGAGGGPDRVLVVVHCTLDTHTGLVGVAHRAPH